MGYLAYFFDLAHFRLLGQNQAKNAPFLKELRTAPYAFEIF